MQGWGENWRGRSWASFLDAFIEVAPNRAICLQGDKRDYLLWAVRFQVSDWSRDTNRWICVEFRVSTEIHSRTVLLSGRRYYDHYRPVNSSLWFRKLSRLFQALLLRYMRLWAVETLTSIGICWYYNPSASIICPFLSKSEAAPIQRLSTQGTPIGRPSRQSHSN